MTAWLSTVGRVRVLSIESVSTERAPRPPSSICVWKRQLVAEHGVAARSIHCVLNENMWAWTCFAKRGLCARQAELSARLLAHLQWAPQTLFPSAELPKLEQVQAVWIRGRQIPLGHCFLLPSA